MIPFLEYAPVIKMVSMPINKMFDEAVVCSFASPQSSLFQDGIDLVKRLVSETPFYGFYYRDRLYVYHPNKVVQFFCRMWIYKEVYLKDKFSVDIVIVDYMAVFNEFDIKDDVVSFRGMEQSLPSVGYGPFAKETDPLSYDEPVLQKVTVDDIFAYIMDKQSDLYEQVPCLVGETGVGKTYIVEHYAEMRGYNLVELRVAYLHKLDVQGLPYVREGKHGLETHYAQLEELVYSSDQYRLFCQDKIDAGEGNDHYRRWAKPCVLYFDDISRGSAAVLNTFTILFNQRFLENLTYYGVRICASATQDSCVDMIEDPAVAQRFLVLRVSPERRDLNDFISKQNPFVQKVFAQKPWADLFRDANSEVDVPCTLFSWQNLSKLLDLNVPLPEDLIRGLFGKVGDWLITALGERVYKLGEEEDVFSVCLDLCVRAGVAIGMFGVTGMGKTQRIRDYANKHGLELCVLELSQMSSSDVMGKPEVIRVDLGDLGDRVVVRAPQVKMVELMERVDRGGVIINFDEVNRLTRGSEALLSVVSQAITSRVIGGVSIPESCALVCTGNLNVGGYVLDDDFGEKRDYDAVSQLDNSIRSRLAFLVKTEYTKSDIPSYRRYILDCNLHPRVKSFLMGLTDAEMLRMLSSSEFKSMENNVMDFRAIKMLDLLVKEHPILQMEGRWCFTDVDDYCLLLRRVEGVEGRWVGSKQYPNLIARLEYLLHTGFSSQGVMNEIVQLVRVGAAFEKKLSDEMVVLVESVFGVNSSIQDSLISALMGVDSLNERFSHFPWTLEEAILDVDYAYQKIRLTSGVSVIPNWKDWILTMCQNVFDYASFDNFSKESLKTVAVFLYLIMQMPLSVQTLVVDEIESRWGDLIRQYEAEFIEIEKEGF